MARRSSIAARMGRCACRRCANDHPACRAWVHAARELGSAANADFNAIGAAARTETESTHAPGKFALFQMRSSVPLCAERVMASNVRTFASISEILTG
jgi:hypothetical protein